MKLLPRLVIVLVVCLVAMALPATPAQAQCGGPSIELSPSSGAPGTEVTVTGQYFDDGKYVDIYYDETRIATGKTDGSGDFTIHLTIPESCKGDHKVLAVVGTYIGTVKVDTYFAVKPGLTINLAEGPVGTNVTVTAQGFAQNEQGIELLYFLNDNYQTIQRRITANATGSWETSFSIPSSTKGEHRIDAQSAESQFYEVQDATFKVTSETSLDKPWGSMGDTITMTGSRFVAYEKNIQILFDGQAVVTGIKADAQGNWAGTFEVPEMPAGTYSVTAQGEATKKEDISALSFEIEPDIELPPDQGYVGMNLTVTGHGFAANKDVVIMYDGNQKGTATTNTTGSFEVSFLVPETHHSEHQVTAEDAAGNNATAIFTMESTPPPMPTPTSPSNGGWVGLVGRVTPEFEWSAVSDDSGVYYSLQIATSNNVTATGEFVHPLVSVSNIVGTNYTLNATDALPDGTYYWIVQAVDGAGNARDWTTAHSFRAGLLPMWASILIIVAIVVLLGVLIYFSIIRRRRYYHD
jgi:hypothetical protein